MKETEDKSGVRNESIDSPIWLDRLIDGEVSADEQRQLLLSLEAQPDGWRRCALAFVETQSLRSDLRGAVSAQLEEDAKPQAWDSTKRGNRGGIQKVRWFAMAACFALAFSIGLLTRGLWTPGAAKNGAEFSAEKVVAMGHQDTPSGNEKANAPATPVAASNSGSVEVPIVVANEANWQAMLAEQKPVLSEAEKQKLESAGHLVQERRAFYPVQLGDGRQAVVPVDLVEVRDTGGWQ